MEFSIAMLNYQRVQLILEILLQHAGERCSLRHVVIGLQWFVHSKYAARMLQLRISKIKSGK